MATISVVIPAFNERDNVERVIQAVPVAALRTSGWETEILLVDNGSTDGTGEIARHAGARVVVQPVRGYGNAYKAGFANATGAVIATGDADQTYPFDDLPRLIDLLVREQIDFLNTDRLSLAHSAAMKRSHRLGNVFLSHTNRVLLDSPFRDSQSGMWVFWRRILPSLDILSGGMAFSQEIKYKAVARGFRCGEVPIEYRPRGGDVKLHAARDGLRNLGHLAAMHRVHHRAESSPIFVDLHRVTPTARLAC
jgi:glycosyltransferase involved in cell wall biosynthesis